MALGERVRNLRARRGLTRKAVAQAAAVSERHLANLEYGIGNASILVLQQVAGALQCSLAELVGDVTTASPEWLLIRELLEGRGEADLRRARIALGELLGTAAGDPARHRRIALIGLRGAGKSTLGAQLAAQRGVPFVELDREIEREAGTSMNEILLLHGQAGYRRYERRALLRIAEEHAQGVVMTTGGSIVSERETFDLLQSHFYCVWLKASPEEHMTRVVAQGDMRPFDTTRGATNEALDDIRRILASREALYARADAVVDTAARSVKQSLKDLERAVPAAAATDKEKAFS
ncbi:MAG: helix-turn-helix transcriptional regulator [Variovorax sp.]